MRRTTILWLAIAAVSSLVQGQQNTVTNSTFDSNIAFWGGNNVTLSWNPADANGVPNSGSLEVQPAAATPSALLFSSSVGPGPDCLSHTDAADLYILDADFSFTEVAADPATLVAGLHVCWAGKSPTPCDSMCYAGLTASVNASDLAWHKLRRQFYGVAPDDPFTLRINLPVRRDSGVSGSILVDNVRLIAVPDGLFLDDLETGALDQWSHVTW